MGHKKQHEYKLEYHSDKGKKRLGKLLSDSEKTSIIHEAVVQLKSNEEISEKYQIKTSVISNLVRMVKKDRNYLSK